MFGAVMAELNVIQGGVLIVGISHKDMSFSNENNSLEFFGI